MVAVFPAALRGHGFDDLGGGGPALLGGLTRIAGGEFLMRLRQQVAAGGLIGLRYHGFPPYGAASGSSRSTNRSIRDRARATLSAVSQFS